MSAPTEKHMAKARDLRQTVAVTWQSNASVRHIAEELAQAERDGFRDGMKRAAWIAQGWLGAFEGAEIEHVSPRDYAVDVVTDIRNAILSESGEPDQ